VSEVMARVRIGTSAGLLLLYVGGAGRFAGSTLEASLIAACTSCWAASMLRSRVNWSVICELVALLTLVINASEGICPNCRSSGAVTLEAIVCADAPGNVVDTTMVG